MADITGRSKFVNASQIILRPSVPETACMDSKVSFWNNAEAGALALQASALAARPQF